MPCVSIQYNPRVGPLIQVAVFSAETVQNNPAFGQDLSPTMFMALVDTGASNTCISKRIAEELSLVPTGKIQVAGVHGSSATNTYQFAIGFIFPVSQEASGAVLGNLSAHLVDGTEFNNDGCGFDILLGRDIICKGSMQMSFDGHFLMCF
jgi:Aspartyl protease